MKQPAITVLLSVFNGRRYVRQAVESILAQTFEHFEFLIIDDGSTEPISELINSYRDPRINLVRQNNRGLACSLNRGIEEATGEFIARMDADDVSAPNRLGLQYEAISRNKNLDLIGSFFREINDRGEVVEEKQVLIDEDYRLWRLQFHNNYAHGSIMFRKSAVVAAGLYNEQLRLAQDYDLWSRICRQGNSCVIPECLYSHRIRTDGQQASVRNYEAQAQTAARISNRNLTACNPDLTEEQCRMVRALYWEFEGKTFTDDIHEDFWQTFDGFCNRFGLTGESESALRDKVCQDYMTTVTPLGSAGRSGV
ncbi:MAG: glycosyltransferase [Deltaproteobacteria bacterium]|nr:glycosyltransferase [Deltaproteobacteria bacterium]